MKLICDKIVSQTLVIIVCVKNDINSSLRIHWCQNPCIEVNSIQCNYISQVYWDTYLNYWSWWWAADHLACISSRLVVLLKYFVAYKVSYCANISAGLDPKLYNSQVMIGLDPKQG